MFNFFKTFIQPVVKAVQTIVKTVQTWIQPASGSTGSSQQPANMSIPQSTPVTPTPEERERLRRQRAEEARQRKLARMEAEFDRDTARKEADGDDQPLKYPTGYLSKPADAGIRWLGDKEAQKVIQMVQDTPALVNAMFSITSSPKAAFDLLLAQEVDLSSETLLQIVASMHNSMWGETPTFNPKTGESYFKSGVACDSIENCIAALKAFNITIVTQGTPDEEIPGNYSNTMSVSRDFDFDDLQAIYNAIVIIETAAAELPKLQEYLENGYEIHIVPMDNVPGLTVTTTPAPTIAPGPTPTPFSIDTAVARGVSTDGYRVLELDLNDWRTLSNEQQKSWIVIHEFFEINTKDEGLRFDENLAPPEIASLVNSVWEEQINEVLQANRSYPSRYAHSANRIDDFIIEAMTGTIWNSGYATVRGYDSGAGGRSSSAVGEIDSFAPGTPFPPATGTPAYQFRPDEFDATAVPGSNIVIRNVRDIGVTVNGDLVSLEDFVRVYLFGSDLYTR